MVAYTPTSTGTLKVCSTICTPPTPSTLGCAAFCYLCFWILLLSVLASVAVVRCPPAALFSGGGSLSFFGWRCKVTHFFTIFPNFFQTFLLSFSKKLHFRKQKNNLFPIYAKNVLKLGVNCGVVCVWANCAQCAQIVRAYIIKAKRVLLSVLVFGVGVWCSVLGVRCWVFRHRKHPTSSAWFSVQHCDVGL